MTGNVRLLGIYSSLDELLAAGRALREGGSRIVEVFSPFASPKIEGLLGIGESRVRYFTLIGGLLGFTGGFALTVGVALRHGLITGGKPIIAIPPFVIIAFELTILLGALATMGGFLLKARSRQKLPRLAHDIDFTSDHFGLLVACGEEDADAVKKRLADAGAREVRDVSE